MPQVPGFCQLLFALDRKRCGQFCVWCCIQDCPLHLFFHGLYQRDNGCLLFVCKAVKVEHRFLCGSFPPEQKIGASTHTKRCTKCRYTFSASHSFSYTACGNVHNKHCSCGYSVNESHSYKTTAYTASSHTLKCSFCKITTTVGHNFGYTMCGNVHNKHCSCGYTINENHILQYRDKDALRHYVSCVCGLSYTESHEWDMTMIVLSDEHILCNKCYYYR